MPSVILLGKSELRLEYELGYKRGIKIYLALWVGGNSEKIMGL